MLQSGRVFDCDDRDARASMEHDKTVVQEILNHLSFNCKKTDNPQQGSFMRDVNQIILATVTIKYNNRLLLLSHKLSATQKRNVERMDERTRKINRKRSLKAKLKTQK